MPIGVGIALVDLRWKVDRVYRQNDVRPFLQSLRCLATCAHCALRPNLAPATPQKNGTHE